MWPSFIKFAFKYRHVLAGAPLAICLLPLLGEYELNHVTWPLAVLVCIAGLVVRGLAFRDCSYSQAAKQELATRGIYAFVRNPLYLGNVLIIGAATLASEVVWLIPLNVAWALLVYDLVTRHEERRLVQRYGAAYAAYRQQVPKWIPRFAGAYSPASRKRRHLARAMGGQLHVFLLLVPFVIKDILIT